MTHPLLLLLALLTSQGAATEGAPKATASFEIRAFQFEEALGATVRLLRIEESAVGQDAVVQLRLECNGRVVANGNEEAMASSSLPLPGARLLAGSAGGAMTLLGPPPSMPDNEIDWDVVPHLSYQVRFEPVVSANGGCNRVHASVYLTVLSPGKPKPKEASASLELGVGVWRIGSVLRVPGDSPGKEEISVLLVKLASVEAGPNRAAELSPLVGQEAFPLDVVSWSNTPSDTKPTMEGLRGKVVLLDFWATWCGPCVAELPKTQDLWRRKGEAGLRVIGIHAARDGANYSGLLSRLDIGLSFPLCWDERGVMAKAYGVNGIPHYVLIDRSGTIRWVGRFLEEKTVERLLAESLGR